MIISLPAAVDATSGADSCGATVTTRSGASTLAGCSDVAAAAIVVVCSTSAAVVVGCR